MLASLALLVLCSPGASSAQRTGSGSETRDPLLILATRVFDGIDMHRDAGVVVDGKAVVALGPASDLRRHGYREMDLGDATILPGFIDLHTHVTFRKVPHETVLRHGITTVRDLGGPLLPPSGGDGALRLLTAGPILTVPGGYPASVFGKGYIATTVNSVEEARARVGRLVDGGAAVIKIALEPGGEQGAPWSTSHHAAAGMPWPIVPAEIASAIVEEAHRLGKRVSAHIGEGRGAAIALATGVDEWAHVPCVEVEEALLEQAVRQGVEVVTTLDTLSHCPGIHINAMRLAKLGAKFLYGPEIRDGILDAASTMGSR